MAKCVELDRCSICLQLPQQPILQTTCVHAFCAKCICQSLLDSIKSIECPNCRTVIKSLSQIQIDEKEYILRFNFKFKRVKFKIFVDINKDKSFRNYLSILFGIDVKRIKIIFKGKQCNDETILQQSNNNNNKMIEYTIIGSKESTYSMKTQIKTRTNQRINRVRYQWLFFQFSLISWFQSIIQSLRSMTFGDIIEFIAFTITFSLQLIVLYVKSLCNPDIGR